MKGMLNKYTLIGMLLIVMAFNVRALTFTGDTTLAGKVGQTVLETYVLENTSGETQTYTITAGGEAKDWIYLNDKPIGKEALTVTVPAGSTAELYAFITPPWDAEVREYRFSIDINSERETKSVEIIFLVTEGLSVDLEADPQEFSIGQCEPIDVLITVHNPSDVKEIVMLEFSGALSGWSTPIAEPEFVLESKEKKEITLTIQPPCDANLETYTGTITATVKKVNVTSTLNLKGTITDKQPLVIGKEGKVTIDACNDVQTTIEVPVKNVGRIADEVRFVLEGLPWAELVDTGATIKPNEEKKVRITLYRSDANEGTYRGVFKAVSTKFAKETTGDIVVTLSDCYSATIEEVKVPGEACMEEPLSLEFLVKNDKNNPMTLKFSVEGIKAAVDPTEAKLEEGDETKVVAAIDLNEEQPGTKQVKFIAASENFYAERTYDLNILDCYNLAIDLSEISELIRVEAGKEVVKSVEVSNTGAKSQKVEVKVQGEAWAYYAPEEFTLASNETRKIYLYFSPSIDQQPGKYEVSLTVTAKDFNSTSVINLEVFGGLFGTPTPTPVPEETPAPTPKPIQLDVNALAEPGETEDEVVLKLIIRNTTDKNIEVVSIKARDYNTSVDTNAFTLTPDENKEVTMKVTVKPEDLNKGLATIPVMFYTDRGIVYKEIKVDLNKLAEMRGTGMLPLSTLITGTLVVLIVVLLLATVAVSTLKKKSKARTNEKYICDECGKEFSSKIALEGHKRTHK